MNPRETQMDVHAAYQQLIQIARKPYLSWGLSQKMARGLFVCNVGTQIWLGILRDTERNTAHAGLFPEEMKPACHRREQKYFYFLKYGGNSWHSQRKPHRVLPLCLWQRLVRKARNCRTHDRKDTNAHGKMLQETGGEECSFTRLGSGTNKSLR